MWVHVGVCQTLPYGKCWQGLKSSGTRVINVFFCPCKSQDLRASHPLYHLETITFCPGGLIPQEKRSLASQFCKFHLARVTACPPIFPSTHVISLGERCWQFLLLCAHLFLPVYRKPSSLARRRRGVACTSTFSWFCCSAEVQTAPRPSDIGMPTNTVARVTQHPNGQDRRDFIFTPTPACG